MENELKSKILVTIKLIDNITNQFYQQKNGQAFENLLSCINDITDIIDHLTQLKNINQSFDYDEKELLETLKKAMNALELKDTVLLADILQYELNDQLGKIYEINI